MTQADFWLPKMTKELYSEYRLMNIKNHEIYSSKFGINVLNLKAVGDDSVAKEPEELYEWAKLFKATTWEEIKMLAEKNEYIADTVVTLKQLTADEKIRMQCQAREDYEHDRATLLRQGRAEGRAEGRIEGRAEEKEANICKLAASYMKQDSSLTEDKAIEMARAILD